MNGIWIKVRRMQYYSGSLSDECKRSCGWSLAVRSKKEILDMPLFSAKTCRTNRTTLNHSRALKFGEVSCMLSSEERRWRARVFMPFMPVRAMARELVTNHEVELWFYSWPLCTNMYKHVQTFRFTRRLSGRKSNRPLLQPVAQWSKNLSRIRTWAKSTHKQCTIGWT